MGSRSAGGEKATAWVAEAGERASEGTFEDAAAFGELLINCTAGTASLAALEQAGSPNIEGKVLIDVANPLDFSTGELRLSVCNDDSLAEQIQRAHPGAKVVKALNTMNCQVMVDPTLVSGDHVAYLCGEDEGAKEQVRSLLGEFGWPADRVLDLGGIRAARGLEMYLPFWLENMRAQGTANFNVAIQR